MTSDSLGGGSAGLGDSPQAGNDPSAQRLPSDLEHAAITFSGGGFRATLFHLGVLFVLIKNRVINESSLVVGVSGGAVLAAHWATNRQAFGYKGASLQDGVEFKGCVARLLALIRSDLRNRVFRRRLLRLSLTASLLLSTGSVVYAIWLNQFLFGLNACTLCVASAASSLIALFLGRITGQLKGNQTEILEHQYESLLFGNKKLSDLGEGVYLTATSLTNGNLFVAGNSMIALYDYSGAPTEENGETDLTLARLVCASSAFPPAFAPLSFRFAQRTAEAEHFVTDGGVFDNLGIKAIRHTPGSLQFNERDDHKLFVIVSDAGRPMQDDTNKTAWWVLNRNIRASDLTMYRLAEMDLQHETSILHLPINDRSVVGGGPNALNTSDIRSKNVAKIRTDLNLFSDPEIACLVAQGADTAYRCLTNKFPTNNWTSASKEEVVAALGLDNVLSVYQAAFDRSVAKRQSRGRIGRGCDHFTGFLKLFFGRDVICLGWLIPFLALASVVTHFYLSFSDLRNVSIVLTELSDQGIEATVRNLHAPSFDLELDFAEPSTGAILWTAASSLSAVKQDGTFQTELTKDRLQGRSYDRLKCRVRLLSGGKVIEQSEDIVQIQRKGE